MLILLEQVLSSLIATASSPALTQTPQCSLADGAVNSWDWKAIHAFSEGVMTGTWVAAA